MHPTNLRRILSRHLPPISKTDAATRAFTLVELLTVLAVIAILAAILIPIVGRVRESARAGECVSNLRQVALALNLYANDNRGFYPTTGDADWVKPDVGIYTYLRPTSSAAYWDANNPASYAGRFEGTALSCPTQAINKPTTFSYGLNELLTLNVTPKKSGTKAYAILAQIGQPSRAALVMETAGSLNCKLPSTTGTEQPETTPRHGSVINVAFVDGHVSGLKPADIPTSASSPFWSISGN